jgi:hypothetical protein
MPLALGDGVTTNSVCARRARVTTSGARSAVLDLSTASVSTVQDDAVQDAGL